MIEYVGDYLIEDNTGRSEWAFWVYRSNGLEYVAHEYFRTYEDALEWVGLHSE